MGNSIDKGTKNLNVPPLRFPEFSGEWERCLLSDFGNVITGNTPSTKETSFYENGERLWASPADLGKSKWIMTTHTKLSSSGFDKTRKLPAGAILITCIGSTIGKMGMASEEMSTNQQINSIITNSSNDKDFVYYTIEKSFPKYLTAIAVQAVPIISKSAFELLPNNRTSLQEQRKIGRMLSLIDERIDTQRKIIDKLETLIRGLCLELTQQEEPNTCINQCLKCYSSILQEGSVRSTGKYPVYGAVGVCGFTDKPEVDDDSILIIKDGASVGTTYYAAGRFSFIGTLNRLVARQGRYSGPYPFTFRR